MKAAAGCRSPRCCALLVVGCFMVAVAPLLAWYGERVTDRSDEPLGVIALVTAVALLGMGFREKQWRAKVRLRLAWMLGGAVLLGMIQSTNLSHFPLVSGLLAVVILGISVDVPGGKPGILALLVLSLPLVASLDFYAGYPLRLAATHVAVSLLNVCGLGVERVGVLMMDGGSVVGMDPPCAGVRMLWTTCFAAAVIAAQRRFAWGRMGMLMVGAVVCVVLGNGLRAMLVFFPESGRVHWPAWMHPGVGLMVHGGVLAAVFVLGEWVGRGKQRVALRSRSPKVVWLAGVGLVGSFVIWLMTNGTHSLRETQKAISWPSTLDGRPLVTVPLSAREGRFAQAFPGQMAKFRCGDEEIIFRRVARATRYMHPSGDCLRAAGFTVTSKPLHEDADGRLWGCSLAERGGEAWRVRERYVNAGGTTVCTDASAWFWEAVLHPGEGPWMAITVMERMPGYEVALR